MNAAHRLRRLRSARTSSRKVPFFDGLTREALPLIAQVTTEESHALGTRIFQYGDPGDKLFIILEGKVRISREVAGMGEEALAVLGPGRGLRRDGAARRVAPLGRRARARALPAARHHARTRSTTCSFCTRTSPTRCSGAACRMLSARLRETNEKLTFLVDEREVLTQKA